MTTGDSSNHGDARLRVLAETSHAFASVVTDYPALLEKIARTTADLVGDGCLVTLLAEDGESMVATATAHRDPELEAIYRAYTAGIGVSKTTSATVSAGVVRTGEPALGAEIDPATIVARTDEVLKPLVSRLNVHSFAVVPIRARGAIIGTLSLVRSAAGRSYTPDDVTLLGDVADRAGLAIESARLYGDLERRVQERTAELEAANNELESFSYSVAHDLRAPLRGIDGFSQALLDEHSADLAPEALAYLGRIRAAAQHMGRLIEDLLALSKVVRADVERTTVDLSACAHLVVAKLREAEPERSVDVVVQPGMIAAADPRLVEILLTNLLGNAWKFTNRREDARIEFGVTRQARPPEYFVRDNGAGFDQTYASKLFGVFQRLHAPNEFQGTGVGLATVQRVAQRHGGRVWAEGAVDQGATFHFTLEPNVNQPRLVRTPSSR